MMSQEFGLEWKQRSNKRMKRFVETMLAIKRRERDDYDKLKNKQTGSKSNFFR